MSEPPKGVRIANFHDERALYALLVDLHRHNQAGWGYPYAPRTVMSQIEVGTRPDPRTRSNPNDIRGGIIGVIDSPEGRLIGTIGLFDMAPAWFSEGTDARALFEIWLYVRPRARHIGRHYRNLFRFGHWAHDSMKADLAKTDYPYIFPMFTGFMHQGNRYLLMERLWQTFCGGRKVGSLYMRR